MCVTAKYPNVEYPFISSLRYSATGRKHTCVYPSCFTKSTSSSALFSFIQLVSDTSYTVTGFFFPASFFRFIIHSPSFHAYESGMFSSLTTDTVIGTDDICLDTGSNFLVVPLPCLLISYIYPHPAASPGINSSNTPVSSILSIKWTLPSYLLNSPTTLTLSALGAHTVKSTPFTPLTVLS